MKKNIIVIGLLFFSLHGFSQIPEDALRHSWTAPSGTARNQALGGANVSLGGDITSLFLNPAGIGLYKTGEVVFSPGYSLYGGKSDYRGTDGTKADQLNRFNVGTTGIVWASPNSHRKWNNTAFSLGINRTANFNSSIHYQGQNDMTSFTTGPRENFTDFYTTKPSGQSNDDFINNAIYNPYLGYTTRMSLATYLVDVDPNSNEVYSRPEDILNHYDGILNQDNAITTKGAITELSFGFASSYLDKFFIGGSLGVPIVSYNMHRLYQETNAAGTNNPNLFNYMAYEEDYKSSGLGFNLKLGAIYKASEKVRLGLAIHTPSIYALSDKYSAAMSGDIGTNYDIYTVKTNEINDGADQAYKYDLRSPTRFMFSGTYMFGAGEQDVTKQKGFITADVEYVNHRWSKFSASGDSYDDDDVYFDNVNNTLKDYYRGCLNFKLGGELKFNTIMARAGFAYYGNPYKDNDYLKADMMNVSVGLGYRNKGIFADLAFVQNLTKDVNFPYRISGGPNTFATVKGSNSNVLLTVGFKF